MRCSSTTRLLVRAAAVLAAAAMPPAVQAQSASAQAPQVFTLSQAIQYAVDHYPTVRAALEQVNVSTAGIDVAKAAYLPRLDSLWQSNRATANNVTGQVLPQSVLPALSGPVLPAASGDSVWGSAVGALFSWEPIDFGLRGATVASAEASLGRARASQALTRLDVQTAVGTAFLGMLAADRAAAAAQADLDRREVLARTVRTLVDNQLRPGAEASRADAERAAAQTRFIQARQALTLSQIVLTRVLGVTTGSVRIDGAPLLSGVPVADVDAGDATMHPLVQVRQAAVDAARAQEDVLARTDLPRLFVQSSVFARGSGANGSGQLDGGGAGLVPDRANWAAGVQVVFPNLFDFSSLRARKAEAAASERAEAALHDEALLTVVSQQQEAAAVAQAARAIAASAQVQLSAAQQSEAQARARYQAGLTSLVEVADTQSLLAQAEVQDELARVDVWRALLAEAAAQGNLAPFLRMVDSSSGGR